jgi:Domain of unknown function (DUF4145)
MAQILVHDCPRCGAREMTFDVTSDTLLEERHGWQRVYEVFGICRGCHASTVFVVAMEGALNPVHPFFRKRPSDYTATLNDWFRVEAWIGLKNMATAKPPEHCPPEVAAAFREGATCLAVECFNAAGTMFRLSVDLTTRPMLPPVDAPGGPDARTRRELGRRLQWLFDNGRLPESLRELAKCIREDGNDGAHAGSLTEAEAEDIKDFTVELLERIFTEPRRLELAQERRAQRRGGGAAPAR